MFHQRSRCDFTQIWKLWVSHCNGNVPCLFKHSNEIDISIGKIAHTVRMFCHCDMLLSPQIHSVVQHHDRTQLGNTTFGSLLVFWIWSCIFILGMHISSGSRTGDTTLICWPNHRSNRTSSLSSMRLWLLFWPLSCVVAFTLLLALSFDTNSAISFAPMLLPSFVPAASGAIDFQFQNNSSFIAFQTEGKSQCLLRILAKFFFPAMWWMSMMPAATACCTRWQDNATQRSLIFEWGMDAELITNSLSRSTTVAPLTGAPRCRSERRKSMTCLVHVLVATCSEPNVAVWTVDCNLEFQSMGACWVGGGHLSLICHWWSCGGG